jgi:hypothetical protein
MPQLYTVRFTTRMMVNKYDAKGKLICAVANASEIVHTALPYSTAMSYSKCDNFKIEPYEVEQKRTSKGSGRDNSVGNGTKKVSFVSFERVGRGVKKGSSLNVVSSGSGHSEINRAAASGDLSAAISV